MIAPVQEEELFYLYPAQRTLLQESGDSVQEQR